MQNRSRGSRTWYRVVGGTGGAAVRWGSGPDHGAGAGRGGVHPGGYRGGSPAGVHTRCTPPYHAAPAPGGRPGPLPDAVFWA